MPGCGSAHCAHSKESEQLGAVKKLNTSKYFNLVETVQVPEPRIKTLKLT